MPAIRGQRQQRVLAKSNNPEELVPLKVRIPDRLRSKAHTNAAALNMSTSAYLEHLLAATPALEPSQTALPLSA